MNPAPDDGPATPWQRRAFAIPMRTRFRGITVREGLLLRGDAGWGEFSPFLDYRGPETVPWLRAAREAAELGWPAPVRDRVPVNVTVPAVEAEAAHRIVRSSGGCRTAKVKVAEPGQDVGQEIARLEAVRDALGPAGRVRVDANGAWDVDTALRRLPLLDRAAGGLEYVEQPCADVADLARVRRRGSVPVAADESIRRVEDPFEVARLEAADVVVLKVQPLGGVRACLDLAERIGLPVVVSSALETTVGLAAGVALAAALPDLPYDCGLNTGRLLTADVVEASLVAVDGALAVLAEPVREITELVGAHTPTRAGREIGEPARARGAAPAPTDGRGEADAPTRAGREAGEPIRAPREAGEPTPAPWAADAPTRARWEDRLAEALALGA